MFTSIDGTFKTELRYIGIPISLFVSFFTNYYYLVPRFLMKNRLALYTLSNIILGVTGSYILYVAAHYLFPDFTVKSPRFMFMRDFFNISVAATVAAVIKYAINWVEMEKKNQKMRIELREAELQNIRNKLNPHFLLNTINNIYALTTFNIEEAQKAIMELGALLRKMLYQRDDEWCSLKEEKEFLDNYINLMKLRVGDKVKVNWDINIVNEREIFIAPMILIIFVENAFKHGVSPTKSTFINITLDANTEKIVFNIENCNYPQKYIDDKEHGIGLKQVKRRLDLIYPDSYEWEHRIDVQQNLYINKLVIYETKINVCNHR